MHLRSYLAGGLGAALLLPLAGIASAGPTTGRFQFEPLPASSPCTQAETLRSRSCCRCHSSIRALLLVEHIPPSEVGRGKREYLFMR